jgi:hypothetical protein
MKNNIQQIESELKELLGDTYGGPSLSFHDGFFILYTWGDAPVSDDEIGRGETIEECLSNYYERKQAAEEEKRRAEEEAKRKEAAKKDQRKVSRKALVKLHRAVVASFDGEPPPSVKAVLDQVMAE